VDDARLPFNCTCSLLLLNICSKLGLCLIILKTNAAAFTIPTFHSQQDNAAGWPQDPFQPSNPQPTAVRSDRPRIIAPAYKWQALPSLISSDPYLKGWNDTIFGNASDYSSQPVVQYFMDGSSGILDVARQVKERIKALSYAYRMTNNTQWADRAYAELVVCTI
jgi:hypothetical protein